MGSGSGYTDGAGGGVGSWEEGLFLNTMKPIPAAPSSMRMMAAIKRGPENGLSASIPPGATRVAVGVAVGVGETIVGVCVGVAVGLKVGVVVAVGVPVVVLVDIGESAAVVARLGVGVSTRRGEAATGLPATDRTKSMALTVALTSNRYQ